jgi:Uma2 family endonuclease
MVVRAPESRLPTLADALRSLRDLGDLPPDRVLNDPPPGKATERDLLAIGKSDGPIYELVDGTLVAKPMGFKESLLAGELFLFLKLFLQENPIGEAAPGDGHVRLFPKLVRAPDVSFVSWERLDASNVETEAFPDLAPDLAIEVLSPSNTKAEMDRKLGEYFTHGVRLVWMIDPRKKRVAVHTAPEDPVILTEEDTLDGGRVLPGFTLPLKTLFAPRRRPGGKGKPKKGKK